MKNTTKQNLRVDELIRAVKAKFEAESYSSKYMAALSRTWDKFAEYAKETENEYFAPSVAVGFLQYYNEEQGYAHREDVHRALNALNDYCNYGELLRRTKAPRHIWDSVLGEKFSEYFEQYQAAGFSWSTVNEVYRHLRAFMEYLDTTGVKKIEDVDSCHLYGLIEDRFPHCTKKWKNHILHDIRSFLEYLHTQGTSVKVFDHVFPTVRAFEGSGGIPNVFTKDEVMRLLEAVDRGSPIGKRDYAILLLATRYGLRASDIKSLCFDNLDWKEKIIRIVQSKTGENLTLPLIDDVGWAIIDYVDHARPVTSSPDIFVSHNAPHKPFMSSMNHIVEKYMRIAKIPFQRNRKPGLHALRHALATELLRDNIPISSVKEVLGHASINTTVRYQRMDMVQLALCTLEVPDVQE